MQKNSTAVTTATGVTTLIQPFIWAQEKKELKLFPELAVPNVTEQGKTNHDANHGLTWIQSQNYYTHLQRTYRKHGDGRYY